MARIRTVFIYLVSALAFYCLLIFCLRRQPEWKVVENEKHKIEKSVGITFPYKGPLVPSHFVGPDGLPRFPHLLLYNKNLCAEKVEYLIYVCTTRYRRERRDIIRGTYGNKLLQDRFNFRIVFLLGISNGTTQEDSIPGDLRAEHDLHEDLVIGDFIDSYKNLSLKGLTAFNYITHFCSHVIYAIKTDDDVIVNVELIFALLKTKYGNNRRTVHGRIHKPYAPFICPHYPKWCVNKEDYPRKEHPPYMAGTGYILSTDVVRELYKVSLLIPVFFLEDIYITGLLVERHGNVSMVDWGNTIHIFDRDACRDRTVAFSHAQGEAPHVLRDCWLQLQNSSKKEGQGGI